jgi:hypothetical protein
MTKATHSSSSRADEGAAPAPPLVKVKGPGATVVCAENALRSIINNKLPVAYQSLAALEFPRERVSIEAGGSERVLQPRSERMLPVSSLVREGRIHAESDPMFWEPCESVKLSRTISIIFSDISQVRTSLRFRLTNDSGERRLVKFRWDLTLPRCVPYAYDQQGGSARLCPDGEFPREARQRERLGFSFDSQRFDAVDNRLLLLSFQAALRPSRVATECLGDRRQLEAEFAADLRPGETRESVITLDFLSLMRQQVSSTIFLVARTDRENRAAWQGAVAASSSWIDRLETCREGMLSGLGFRRFAPFLWFERDKPLSDQVLRFIHNMPCLERVIVFGEVLQHDLENLLTALLDKGGDRPLRLHIFTDNEYYRDRVNVLRGNIQARMIIADETPERVRRLEEIVCISVVPDPCRLPLALRYVMEEMSAADYFTPPVHDTNVFVVPSDVHQARLVAAACVPLARHLGASLLLWSPATGPDILNFLRGRNVLRLFLVGGFSPDDERSLRATIATPAGSRSAATVVRIPYSDPVRASAALSRLFRAHYLLDWLLHALRAERGRIAPGEELPLSRLARSFVERIRGRSWAKRNLAVALEAAIAGGDFEAMLAAYQDVFVGRDEFLRAFKEHFMEAALAEPALLSDLAPVWSDLVVVGDFTREGGEHVFSAACFAAYHGAPFLLFPAISQEKESYLDQRVREFERQYFNLYVQVPPHDATLQHEARQEPVPAAPDASRSGGDAESLAEQRTVEHADIVNLFAGADQLASVIFPSDVRTTVEALNPLTVALFNSDVKVPYEAISGHMGPLSLNFAMGRLAGANAFETSIITSAGMLFAPELHRQQRLNLLLCLANLPGTGRLNLEEEEEAIRKALESAGEKFCIKTLSELHSITKECVLEELGGSVHIFHFSGHGQENTEQPQRSGILLWNERAQRYSSLNALEVKYRTKLGAHPVVFLNTCFGSSNSRISLDDADPTSPELSPRHDSRRAKESFSAFTTEQVIGVSSSFIHSGSAAVMAPLWEMYDNIAIEYARHWYTYMEHGCSIGEAALLAKCDTIAAMYGQSPTGFRSLSYVIYGDPTLRLFPLRHLVEAYPETARRLLELKRTVL